MADEKPKLGLIRRALTSVGFGLVRAGTPSTAVAKATGTTIAGTGNAGGEFFGPGQPLRPMGPTDERSRGRRDDYSLGLNYRLTKSEGIDFWELRALAETHDVTRLLIETRKDQMEALSWAVRPIPKTEETKGEEEIVPEVQGRIDATTKFLRMPDGEQSFSAWIRELIEDMLVIDAATIYVNDWKDPDAIRFEIVDGATILRRIDERGRTPGPPEPAYQQILKGLPAFNYSTDELIYLPRNPRPNRLYGMSPVQQIVILVNIALRREFSQLEYYTAGNVPDALISVPLEWTPKDIKTYQEWWDSTLEGNTAERRKAKFVPGGSKMEMTRKIDLKDEFDEWLARVACFAFSVPPTAFVKQMNRATAETAKEAAEEEGLGPIMRWAKQVLDRMIQRHLGQYDLEFVWETKKDTDPEIQAAVHDKYVRMGAINLDEVRDDLGREPIPDGLGAEYLVYTATGPVRLEDAIKKPEEKTQDQLDSRSATEDAFPPEEQPGFMPPGKGPPGATATGPAANKKPPGAKGPPGKAPPNGKAPPSGKAPPKGEVGEKADRPFSASGSDTARSSESLTKYSEDQPRDERGRWGTTGGVSEHPKLSAGERVYNGKQVETEAHPSKQETGAIGEKIAIAYLQSIGLADARGLNLETTNFPVDLVGDHQVFEVKTGLVSNSRSAQQWRATIGQPGPTEAAWLKTATPQEKALWNAEKQQAIMERKADVTKEFSRDLGTTVKGATIGVILNPDTKTADIHVMDGFHSRVGWNSEQAKHSYVGSFKYE